MVGGWSYRVNYQSIDGAYADAPSMLGTPDYNWFNMSNTVMCSNSNDVVCITYLIIKMLKQNPKFYYTLGCPTAINTSWLCINSIDFQKMVVDLIE